MRPPWQARASPFVACRGSSPATNSLATGADAIDAAICIAADANPDFFTGNRFAQAPLYLVRGGLIRSFESGAWVSLDGVYLKGGRITVNGIPGDNEQENLRGGFTIGLPIDRQNSLKLNASTGIYSRTGSTFSLGGMAWQYRWGDGD